MSVAIVINVLLGLIFFIMSFAFLKYKAVFLLVGYKDGKYDDEVCKIVGGASFIIGLFFMINGWTAM